MWRAGSSRPAKASPQGEPFDKQKPEKPPLEGALQRRRTTKPPLEGRCRRQAAEGCHRCITPQSALRLTFLGAAASATGSAAPRHPQRGAIGQRRNRPVFTVGRLAHKPPQTRRFAECPTLPGIRPKMPNRDHAAPCEITLRGYYTRPASICQALFSHIVKIFLQSATSRALRLPDRPALSMAEPKNRPLSATGEGKRFPLSFQTRFGFDFYSLSF